MDTPVAWAQGGRKVVYPFRRWLSQDGRINVGTSWGERRGGLRKCLGLIPHITPVVQGASPVPPFLPFSQNRSSDTKWLSTGKSLSVSGVRPVCVCVRVWGGMCQMRQLSRMKKVHCGSTNAFGFAWVERPEAAAVSLGTMWRVRPSRSASSNGYPVSTALAKAAPRAAAPKNRRNFLR